MKRVAVFLLVASAFALAPAAINAQGLFGSGLPSFGGFMGGPSACGEKCGGPAAATTFYVGWMDDPNGVSADFTRDGLNISTFHYARQKYRLSGLWLGLSQTCPLTENIGIVASGWYLLPSNKKASESYFITAGGIAPINIWDGSEWSTKNEWWFVDGLFALGSGNAQLLAGIRYDYLATKFNRDNDGRFVGNPGGRADVRSQGIIPLVGLQYAQTSGTSSLLFRIVGIPTLVGSFRYTENLGVVSLDGSSNYNGGYFLEAFGEYGYKTGGLGEIGFFGRYNTTEGKSTVNFDWLPTNFSGDYKLTLHRSSWTLGAKFSLSFTLPYM